MDSENPVSGVFVNRPVPMTFESYVTVTVPVDDSGSRKIVPVFEFSEKISTIKKAMPSMLVAVAMRYAGRTPKKERLVRRGSDRSSFLISSSIRLTNPDGTVS
jgi:hypothetical protein